MQGCKFPPFLPFLDTRSGINPKVLLSFTSSKKEAECRRLLETFNSRRRERDEKFSIVRKKGEYSRCPPLRWNIFHNFTWKLIILYIDIDD